MPQTLRYIYFFLTLKLLIRYLPYRDDLHCSYFYVIQTLALCLARHRKRYMTTFATSKIVANLAVLLFLLPSRVSSLVNSFPRNQLFKYLTARIVIILHNEIEPEVISGLYRTNDAIAILSIK